jgi:arsenate reductase (thioredoxin)
MEKKTVLFICSFNSIRSQIAEGLLNARCGDHYTACSAGIAPAGLNPYAVAVMKEAGIDISSQKSKKLNVFTGTRFDYVVILCDRAKMAVTGSIPEGATVVHRGFMSPSELRKNKAEVLADFRTLRDEIDTWLLEMFPECNGKDAGQPDAGETG